MKHGPGTGDELNWIEKGKNYGWPPAGEGPNYNGVPVPNYDTRPDLAMPVLFWAPVIAPGDRMFYHGTQTFPQWDGWGAGQRAGDPDAERIVFDGRGGAKSAERWRVGKRIRDLEDGPRAPCGCSKTPIPAVSSLIDVTPKWSLSEVSASIAGARHGG